MQYLIKVDIEPEDFEAVVALTRRTMKSTEDISTQVFLTGLVCYDKNVDYVMPDYMLEALRPECVPPGFEHEYPRD